MEFSDRQLTQMQEGRAVSLPDGVSIGEILRALATLGIDPNEVQVSGLYTFMYVEEK